MDATQVNAILTGTKSVLEGYLALNVATGTPSINQGPVLGNQISVIVGVTGDIEGELVLGMSKNTVKKIIGRMFGGMEIEEIDDMGWSAFSEFGNWVGGSCSSELGNTGLNTNITPPIINEGDSRFHSKNKFISIPFDTEIEQIMVHISIKGK